MLNPFGRWLCRPREPEEQLWEREKEEKGKEGETGKREQGGETTDGEELALRLFHRSKKGTQITVRLNLSESSN